MMIHQDERIRVMEDCLFCKIARGEIPGQKVYEDERVLAFRDISPQAPTHVLIIPKTHISGLDGLDGAENEVLAALLRAANTVARMEGVDKSGYRLVSNMGPDACQSVKHLHFHVLGGRQLDGLMG